MTCPSPKRTVCKLYDKALSCSSSAFRGPSHGRRARIHEAVRPFGPIIVHVRRGQVDLDQLRRGAHPCASEQYRRQRVSLEVGVALFGEPGGDADHLVPRLGHRQRHIGGPRKGISYSCRAGLRVGLAVGFEDASVGLRVGPGEGRDPKPRGVRPADQPRGVGELGRGEAGGHASQSRGEGHRDGGHGASAGGGAVGGHSVEEFSQGEVKVVRRGVFQVVQAHILSEQPDDLTVLVDVYVVGCGVDAEAWHGAHVATDRVDETGPHRGAGLAHRQGPALRRTPQGGVRGYREVRLRHADRQVAEAVLLVGVELAARGQVVLDAVSPVHPGGDGLYLLLQGRVFGVEEVKIGRLLGGLGDRLGQVHGPLAALREVVADRHAGAHLLGHLPDGIVLRFKVGGERVDRHHRRDAVQPDVLDLLPQVVSSSVNVAGVLLQHLLGKRLSGLHLVTARVDFQRPHRSHEHRRVGLQSRVAALDVEEPLGAHVRTEARLGYEVIAAANADQVCHNRGVAGGDVAEGTGVYQSRGILQRLHQVRLYSLLHDHGHGARCSQVFGRDGVPFGVVSDHDAPQPPSEVLQRGRERQDCHHFGGRSYVEACLAGDAVGPGSQAGDDVPQGPVVYVHHPSPRDGVPVHVEEVVVVVDVVIHHGGKQVVGGGDRVYVAGQVQIEHLHRHHLAVAAARGAALDPEHRPHRSLPHCYRRRLANVLESLSEPHGGRRLPLAQGSRRYGRYDHVLRPWTILQFLYRTQLDLGYALAIGLQQVLPDAYGGGDILQRRELRFAGNLEVLRYRHAGKLLVLTL